MKIYTKKGDKGTTGIIGGKRLPKFHNRIEAYGTVDELNSYIGLLRDLIEREVEATVLLEIQDRLFTIGSHLASDPNSKMQLPELFESDITYLETEIDRMDAEIPTMTAFVLPGGHPTISHIHIARCICRRAERGISLLAENEEVNPLILAYVNRLSDYIFELSRYLVNEWKVEEKKWVPRK